jgi:hypothetical protein
MDIAAVPTIPASARLEIFLNVPAFRHPPLIRSGFRASYKLPSLSVAGFFSKCCFSAIRRITLSYCFGVSACASDMKYP